MSVLMSLRDRRRTETRDLLLDAARRLVAELGPDAATTRAIARAAGVATGTVFAHFPDKQTLLEALLHDHVETALDAALATAPDGPVIERLVHVAEGLWAAYDREPDLARILIAGTLFLSDPGRPLSRQLARFGATVGATLAAGAERGEFEPVEPAMAFSAFFSMYFGLLVGGLRGEVPSAARGPLLRAWLVRFLRPRAAPEVP